MNNRKYWWRRVQKFIPTSALGKLFNPVIRQWRLRKFPLSVAKFFSGLTLRSLVVILILLGCVGVVGGLGFNFVSQLNLRRSEFDIHSWQPELTTPDINTLLLIYDVEGDYAYIDWIGVLMLDSVRGDKKILTLPVDFSVRVGNLGYIQIRSLINNAKSRNVSAVNLLVDEMQSVFGVRLDRYVFINKQDIAKLSGLLDLNTVIDADFTDPDAGTFAKGQVVRNEPLQKYLAADSEGLDSKSSRLNKFLQNSFKNNFNWWNGLRVISTNDWENLISTNFSLWEFLNWSLYLTNNPDTSVVSIAVLDTFLIEEPLRKHLTANVSKVEEKLINLLARDEIKREQARIEIYNATEQRGLAGSYRRLLSNYGAVVIRAGNYPGREERSQLYVLDKIKYANNIRLIQDMTRGKVIIVESKYPYNHTGELVLVLGEDGYNQYDF